MMLVTTVETPVARCAQISSRNEKALPVPLLFPNFLVASMLLQTFLRFARRPSWDTRGRLSSFSRLESANRVTRPLALRKGPGNPVSSIIQ
jgi:hypothetical protein